MRVTTIERLEINDTIMKKPFLIIFSFFVIFSCEDSSPELSKKIKLNPVSVTSIEKEPGLIYALDQVGFISTKNNARANKDGVSLNVEEIVKVMKQDSLRSVYSILVEDNDKNSLTNFIVEELSVGYSAFYQNFRWEGDQLPDFQNFTGIVTRTDLDGNTIMRVEQVDGKIIPTELTNAKTNVAKQCVEDIKTEKYYSDCGIEYKNQVQVFVCRSVTIVITLTVGDCESEEKEDPEYGSGGTSGGPGTSGGTYIPPATGYSPTIPEGASPNSGGTGNSSVPSRPINEPVTLPPTGVQTKIFMRLNNAITIDPFKLQNVPCSELPKWQKLATFKPPKEVIDKLKKLDDETTSIFSGDWGVEDIENAQGAVVNMDYFAVKVTTLPKKPDGSRYTAPELFQYFRKNLNSFLDQSITRFMPYSNEDRDLWNTNSPLGAIMRFDIFVVGDLVSQDASVICSDFQSTSWTFTTIESFADWNHPVSGNRQFGYELNSDGSYNFYVRGVDRVTEQFDLEAAEMFGTNTPFEGADALWKSWQKNFQNFVNDPKNGGTAQKVAPVIYRPDWEKVKDVLKGNRPLSDLGCK